MAQHDYVISNASFPNTRADINNVLSAINSSNSGTSRPSSATTGTIWLDTTNSGSNSLSLKFFDGAQDIELAIVDTSANTVNFLDSVTSGVADNSITLAKLASGTDGNIISYDASGNPVAVATGSSGQVLVSAGAGAVPSFQTVSGNATHSGEVTGSGALTIADNVVDEANLKVSNTPTNGYGLVARSGNTGGMTWEALGGGKILQVKNGIKTAQVQTTSENFQDVSSATSLSMTCASTSSKVLILAHFNECYLTGYHGINLRITAGGSSIAKSQQCLTASSSEKHYNQDITYVHSPSSTSSIEYKLQFCSSSNGTAVGINRFGNPTTSITLIEVGA